MGVVGGSIEMRTPISACSRSITPRRSRTWIVLICFGNAVFMYAEVAGFEAGSGCAYGSADGTLSVAGATPLIYPIGSTVGTGVSVRKNLLWHEAPPDSNHRFDIVHGLGTGYNQHLLEVEVVDEFLAEYSCSRDIFLSVHLQMRMRR